MKSIRKNRLPETYRENHLSQMRHKISAEFDRHARKGDSRLTILQMLADKKGTVKKGEK
jgi:hypothetical protein